MHNCERDQKRHHIIQMQNTNTGVKIGVMNCIIMLLEHFTMFK